MSMLMIGCGRMGQAMLSRWLEEDALPKPCAVIKPTPLPEELRGPDVVHYPSLDAWEGEIPQLIVLAVKPDQIEAILPELERRFGTESCYLSVIAGMAMERYREVLGQEARIVRAMPNTPVRIGAGVVTLVSNVSLPVAERDLVNQLCHPLGISVWLHDEALLDVTTALAGSGPAYVFAFIEALAEAATREGLPAPLADQLARQTVLGSALLASEQEDQTMAALQSQVASKGGTTEAALQQLKKNSSFSSRISEAIRAAITRSRELR